MLENVRYFTVKCEFRKMIFHKEKARKPLYIKDFRTFSWQGQEDLNPRHAVLETAALPTELYPCIKLWWAIRDSNPGPTGYEPVALTN